MQPTRANFPSYSPCSTNRKYTSPQYVIFRIKVPNGGALRGKLRLPLMSEDPVMERMDENPIMVDGDDTSEQTTEIAEQGADR